ncbi:GmrSD restriction endonuclease domain-containing protein [Dermacoccus nishinomiyaensis]|uniref:GmrSD restriction endonuclease domain-containing protein n=1 Tax=Dermacoccus nishinomiyaensis TaxID=1274 RepID=UPI0013F3FEDA|nr:DUF262 domain-containing protein [Dermacoccus nishinomiyaensis]
MTAQTLKAAEINLGKIFSDDFEFEIPEYQRPYAWTTEETLQLLSDLEGALNREDDDEPYFLGSIVLVKAPSQARSEVIDGQQRLTTLTILLAVLRDLVDDARLAADIHKLIEEPEVVWDDRPAQARLTLRPRDKEFFKTFVQTPGATAQLAGMSGNKAETDSQRAVRDNANALREALTVWPQVELQRLFKLMAKRTILVTVSTPDLNSAYRIFSVMNARGLPLAPADIFKAKVVGDIGEEEKRKKYADLWERLEQNLGRREFGELFGYIRTAEHRSRPVRGLLQEFPEQVLNQYLPGRGAQFVDEILKPYAEADLRLVGNAFTGDGPWESVNAWLKRLDQLDNDDWRPVALWALTRHGDDAEYLSSFLGRLERLAASMLIRRVYSTPRSQRYVELLKQLHEGSGLESPAFELTDEELTATRERLDGELYLVRPVRKYVLMRLDSLLAADPGATYDHRVITVEHVLPQRPEPNSGWTQKFDEETAAHWVHRLGNLLLLNRRKNSEASNYDFEMKKHKYFTSTKGVSVFPLTTQVLQEEAWTPEVVQRRHKRLTSLLHDEWRL